MALNFGGYRNYLPDWRRCLIYLGVKQTRQGTPPMSGFDPKRTFLAAIPRNCRRTVCVPAFQLSHHRHMARLGSGAERLAAPIRWSSNGGCCAARVGLWALLRHQEVIRLRPLVRAKAVVRRRWSADRL